jgi:NAD(P)-dependent dehydrogenase (short-subunit alcohol dehydrogenase family)
LADGKEAGKVEVLQMDLGSLESIRAAAQEFLRRSGNKLNVLINNAGKHLVYRGIFRALLTRL